ncbi:MAG: hypothetical protein M1823_003468 [Watsoniomyces obsoletus]|nr:MAG: hypothetical protein M1823_003468 [Watsoniomyces obsoletus]
MADPFTVVGLGLSAASLTFQVFAGCIKGYQLLSEAKDMPKESQYLRVRLEMEHHRLLDWSQVAGLVPSDIHQPHPHNGNNVASGTNHSFSDGQGVNLARNLRLERHLLLDVLSEIKYALENFGKYQGRYSELRPISSDSTNLYQDDQEVSSESHSTKKGEVGHKKAAAVGPESSPSKTQTAATTSKFRSRFPSGLRKKTLESALSVIDNAPQYPRRLRWVVFDAEKFRTLLGRLRELNDFLHSLMDDTQSRHLMEMQHKTHMEILQLHGTVHDLKVLIRALTPKTNVPGDGGSHRALTAGDLKTGEIDASGHGGMSEKQRPKIPKDDDKKVHHQQDDEKEHLVQLARFKALNTSMANEKEDEDEKNSQSRLDSTRLDPNLLTFIKNYDGGGSSSRIEAIYEPPPPYTKEDFHATGEVTGRRHVWIEWKRYEPTHPDPDHPPDPRVVERVQQLAALLGQRNKPVEFRAPQCLGYFYDSDPSDDDGPRFGFVFEKLIRSPAITSKPISLLELIRGTRERNDGVSLFIKGPSLTERKALATKMANCVFYLHSVNWLHKGLRSHNILFFLPQSSSSSTSTNKDTPQDLSHHHHLDLSHPYLSGFDYARPSLFGEMTEKPPQNPSFDIYRHPRVHGIGSYGPTGEEGGFRKSFDIYSLGLILLEIAYWESIDRVVGIENLERAKPLVIAGVRKMLLTDKKYLDGVSFAMGDGYADVVRACLNGGSQLGITDEAVDETDHVVGALLQTGFYENVVRKLDELRM